MILEAVTRITGFYPLKSETLFEIPKRERMIICDKDDPDKELEVDVTVRVLAEFQILKGDLVEDRKNYKFEFDGDTYVVIGRIANKLTAFHEDPENFSHPLLREKREVHRHDVMMVPYAKPLEW